MKLMDNHRSIWGTVQSQAFSCLEWSIYVYLLIEVSSQEEQMLVWQDQVWFYCHRTNTVAERCPLFPLLSVLSTTDIIKVRVLCCFASERRHVSSRFTRPWGGRCVRLPAEITHDVSVCLLTFPVMWCQYDWWTWWVFHGVTLAFGRQLKSLKGPLS